MWKMRKAWGKRVQKWVRKGKKVSEKGRKGRKGRKGGTRIKNSLKK